MLIKEKMSRRLIRHLLGGALRLAGWVAEGKDDGPVVEGGHVLEDLLGEDASDGGRANQASGLQITNDIRQVL